jgi:acyl-CoA synthetase (AMP-forming)/AMP-acid ligase II
LDLTTPSLVSSAAEAFGAQPAVVTETGAVSFAELADEVRKAAAGFMALGVERGDHVAIWAPNSLEWIIACLGLQCAGAVLTPINTRYRGDEAGHILSRSQAKALVTVGDFLGVDYLALLEGQDLPKLQSFILLDEGPRGLSWPQFLKDGARIEGSAVAQRMGQVGPADYADLLFTSGTTGRPKGVRMTHRQDLDTYRAFSGVVDLQRGDRYLIVNPFFHAFGYKAGILASLLVGMTIYPRAVFDAEEVMGQIERERITVFPAAPSVYQMMLDHPRFRRFDLSSLRSSVTGAASVPVELVRRMRSELGFRNIHVGWGLTEACGVGTMTRIGDPPEVVANTVGPALYPELELRVAGPEGEALPAGEQGELMLRGMSVMEGYFDDPAATAEALDGEGWLHTGDIGVLDESGYLKVTDRKKDMFIVGGFNAYPAEIESIMLGSPQISQVALVGVPDHRLGEVGVAFVVARPDASPSEAEIIEWCKNRMANFKAPRRVFFCAALPMNASNKVLKHQLKEEATRRLESRAVRAGSEPTRGNEE